MLRPAHFPKLAPLKIDVLRRPELQNDTLNALEFLNSHRVLDCIKEIAQFLEILDIFLLSKKRPSEVEFKLTTVKLQNYLDRTYLVSARKPFSSYPGPEETQSALKIMEPQTFGPRTKFSLRQYVNQLIERIIVHCCKQRWNIYSSRTMQRIPEYASIAQLPPRRSRKRAADQTTETEEHS
mmetsp:Transcript_34589/g.83680  ORF Transcript_34589/g.83680 Transcript_34589/m.83680 type:complete len:181 (-) Transcript_34589:73-615(-)